MPNIGPLELIIVLVIILVIFGPKRLPQLGRQLGSGMREFKDSVTGKNKDEELEEDANAALGRPELTRSQQADPVDATPEDTRRPAGEPDESATRRGA